MATIHKCDNCGQEMSEKTLTIGLGYRYMDAELCYECSVPLFDQLSQLEVLREKIAKLRIEHSEL